MIRSDDLVKQLTDYVEGLYQKAVGEGAQHHGEMKEHNQHKHDEFKKESSCFTHEKENLPFERSIPCR
jgi:hypothetical protein